MAISKTARTGAELYGSGADPHPGRVKHNEQTSLLDRIMALAAQGATTARPTAGIYGRFFWDTTVSRLYWDDGTAWREITTNGGAGPGGAIVPDTAAIEGVSARSARADHTHFLRLATQTEPGAMSSRDKALLETASNVAGVLTMVQRDAFGRAEFGSPISALQAANKSYVDNQVSTSAPAVHNHTAAQITSGVLNAARLPVVTPTVDGAMLATDKVALDASTYLATPNTLAQRGTSGQIYVGTPTNGAAATTKDYVDSEVSTRSLTSHTHTWAQILSKPTTFAPSSHTHPWSQITSTPSTFPPSSHNHTAAQITSGVLNAARLPSATSSAEGTMSAADKRKLDAASSSSAANTLMMTDSNGRFSAVTPSAAAHVANKAYVDSQVSGLPTKIARGSINVSNLAVNQVRSANVPFGTTFPGVPQVFFQSSHTRITTGLGSRSTTSASVTIANYTDTITGGDSTLYWVAIY